MCVCRWEGEVCVSEGVGVWCMGVGGGRAGGEPQRHASVPSGFSVLSTCWSSAHIRCLPLVSIIASDRPATKHRELTRP